MNEKKTVLGIALLFAAMTGLLSVLAQLPSLILYRDITGGKAIIHYTLVLLILAVCITLTLYILNRKQGQSLKEMFKDNVIRKSTGVLSIIIGLIYSSTVIQLLISSLCSYIKYKSELVHTSVVIDSVNVLLVIILVLFGVYLLRSRNCTVHDDGDVKKILGITLQFTFISGIFSFILILSRMLGEPNIFFYLVQLAVTVCIPLTLYLIFTKKNRFTTDDLNDNSIRHSVGALVVIDGTFKLAPAIISLISGVMEYYSVDKTLNADILVPIISRLIQKRLLAQISITLLILQILLGVSMLRSRKRKENNEGES